MRATFGEHWITALDALEILTPQGMSAFHAAITDVPPIEICIARNHIRQACRQARVTGPMYAIDQIVDTVLLYHDHSVDTVPFRTAIVAAAFDGQLDPGPHYPASVRDQILEPWRSARIAATSLPHAA
ncbi:hypothetical protein GS531_03815 [Rhodococcus hoagii]|nr:hypothetical protein [Prescottella equi]